MKSLLHFVLVLMTSTLLANPSTSKVDFIEGSLSLAIQKAGIEGKLLFVEFGAKWCMPCRFMDENTFRDQDVVQFMSANYVPVKIDIDDFDGFAYKQKYQVQALPTFLVLNSSGNVIARYEKSMAPSNLLNILRQHNINGNKLVIDTDMDAFEIEERLHEAQKEKYNISPYTQPNESVEVVEDAPVEANDDPVEVYQKVEDVEVVEVAPTIKDMLDIEMDDEYLWEEEKESSNTDIMIAESVEETPLLESAVEEVSPAVVFYTVKLGTFANERSKNDFIKATSSIFVEDTHIFQYDNEGLVAFDVCLGAFASEQSAEMFIDRLSLLNIFGEIKKIEQ